MTDKNLYRVGLVLAVVFVAGATLAAVFGINVFSDLPTNLG